MLPAVAAAWLVVNVCVLCSTEAMRGLPMCACVSVLRVCV